MLVNGRRPDPDQLFVTECSRGGFFLKRVYLIFLIVILARESFPIADSQVQRPDMGFVLDRHHAGHDAPYES